MATTEKFTTENDESRRGDVLLEKLRSKAAHMKPWGDSIKAFRIALMDKRCSMDNAERLQIQKCLDTLQKTIKVTSLQSMVERLESITRQLSLKFLAGPNGTECFISSDMFYVEVVLEVNGSVKDVKIAHHGDPVSCTELSEVLSSGDFAEFTKHLEGLAAIYQLNADKKQKSKAYLALQALETDLSMLAQLQSSINEPSNFVHKSPVGILQPRKGGHPMKLTYFISPYDLLDMETKSSIPLTVETVIERQLGHYVTVCIESSTSHKLQTQSLMSISRTPEGKSLPSFAAPSNLNSTTLPASFVLKLATPVPIAVALVRKIQTVTCIECADMSTSQSLLSLITQHASNGELDCSNNKGLFVVLPDQHHCYFLNGASDLQGVMVSSIPFTHPTHVPQILVFLRQQMLFNVLISSCIRTCSKQDLETALMFEVTALSWLHISVSFEHPLEESMATAEFDLTDITNVKCKLYTMSSDASICSDEYASKVIQRCLSIPVTMRAVIRKAQGQQKKCNQSNEDLYLTMVMGNSGKFSNHPPNYSDLNSSAKFVSDFDMKPNRAGNRSSDSQSIGKLDMLNSNVNTSSYGSSSPEINNSLGLESQSYSDSSSPAHGDLFSINSDRAGSLSGSRFSQSHANPSSGKPSLVNNHQFGSSSPVGKPRKERGKRKNAVDGSSPRSNTGRSPKRKHTDDDSSKDMQSVDIEANGNSLSLSYGLNMEMSAASSGSTAVGGMDESHVSKLASSLDSIIKYENIIPRSSSSDMATLNSSEHELHRSSNSSVGSLHDLIDKTGCESSTLDSDIFNTSSQSRTLGNDFQFKTEPLDFETEVLNQNPSFDGSLIEGNDEFNLEQLGILPKVNSSSNSGGGEKQKESKKMKKVKLELPSKLEKEHGGGSEGEKQPPPVILDIISNQVKVIDTSKSTPVAELTEKRPSVEIIPIGTSSSSTSSILSSGIKIVNSSMNSEKMKQREFRRGLNISERSEKKSKSEVKRERKRKHLESLNGADEKPTKIFGLSITALPPKSSPSTSIAEPTLPKSITVSMKPITSPTSGSSSSLSNKLIPNKKPHLPAGTTVSPTKSISILKTPQGNKVKPSLKSSSGDSKNAVSSKVTVSPLKVHNKFKSNSSGSSSSSSGFSSKSGSHSPTVQGNSPSKVCTKPATVKLKQLNIPNSTTVTPINKICSPTNTSSPSSSSAATLSLSSISSSSNSSSQPTSTPSSVSVVTSPTITTSAITKSMSVTPANLLTASSNSNSNSDGNNGAHYANSGNNNNNNNNNLGVENENGSNSNNNNNNNGNGGLGNNSSNKNKSVNRSRKPSLSAIVDKLAASNRQTHTPCGENQQFSDKKMETKGEGAKDKSSGNQKSSDKPKTSNAEQKSASEKKPEFTVKQSSQGIKLTVTKTRSTEGGTKLSSSLKSSSSSNSNSGSGSGSGSSSSSSGKCSSNSKNPGTNTSSTKSGGISGSATGLKPGVNSGPASKKLHTSSTKTSGSSASSGGNPSISSSSSSSQSKASLSVPKNNTSISSSSKSQSSHSSSGFKPSPKHGNSESRSSSNSTKSQEKFGKSPVHEGRPSTPKLDKSNNAACLTNMPPPPVPSQSLDMGISLRKNEEISSSGRQGSVRQNSKIRDSQPEETEAERQFRLLLGETKTEVQTPGSSAISSSSLAKATPNVTSGASNISASSAADRPEGSRTPKQDLPDKSPKHTSSSDGRSTPKSLASEKFVANAAKCGASESKRPSTPKLGDSLQKTVEGHLPLVPSPAENLKFGQSQSSSSTLAKPKLKCLSSPSHDDVSSPEGSLIIDYPGTPHQKSPDKKLVKNSVMLSSSESTLSNSQAKSPDKLSPSSLIMTRSPSQSSPSIKSPAILGTPQSDHSNPSSVARSSPCVIDDDLMDEALIGIGK